ncbi:MAG: hypothetical protein MCSN_1650 [Candidatus Microsyncoccus archaeolyticus]|jgi:hypothetical protein|nr:MAG: hypothetical protein MCSN_1650 [Candidatus Parcubacteria bacterium]
MENESEIFYTIATETVQPIANDNLGRELTDDELKRLRDAFIECDAVYTGIWEAVSAAIDYVVKNKE